MGQVSHNTAPLAQMEFRGPTVAAWLVGTANLLMSSPEIENDAMNRGEKRFGGVKQS